MIISLETKRTAAACTMLIFWAVLLHGRMYPRAESVFSSANHCTLQDLVGAYYCGDGLAFNSTLIIYADGTFKRESASCDGAAPATAGTISFFKNRIVLYPGPRKRVHLSPDWCPVLCPVRWGDRMYLVDALSDNVTENAQISRFLDIVKDNEDWETGYHKFCSQINDQREPRQDMHGSTFLRCGDEHQSASGTPELPEPWKREILKSPVSGAVTKAINASSAIVNLGSTNGLRRGMMLCLWERDNYVSVRVVAVRPNACLVRIPSFLRALEVDKRHALKPCEGQRVTSVGFPASKS